MSALIPGIVTTVLLLSFLGIAAWAYSGARREHFEAAARAPLEEEGTP